MHVWHTYVVMHALCLVGVVVFVIMMLLVCYDVDVLVEIEQEM